MLITATTFEQTAAPATPHELGELAYLAFCQAHLGGMNPIPRKGRAGDWASFASAACEHPVERAHHELVVGTGMTAWRDLDPATRRAFTVAADAAALAPMPEKKWGFSLCAWALCRNHAARGFMTCHGCPDHERFARLLQRRNEARAAQALRDLLPPDRAYASFVAHRTPGTPNPAPTAWRASWAAFAAASEAGARPHIAYRAYVALAPARAMTPLPWGQLLPSTRGAFSAAARAVLS